MLCSSSLAERTSSFEACSSSLAASCCCVTAWRYRVASASSRLSFALSLASAPSTRARALGASAARTPGLGACLEEHEQRALVLGRASERHHLQVQPADLAPVTQRHALPADGRVLLPGILDRLADFEEEPPARHLEEVQARATVGVLQVGFGLATELDDVVLLVHDHARWCVPGQEDPVRLPGQLLGKAGLRGHRPDALLFSTLLRGAAETEDGRSGGGPPGVDPVLPVHGREEVLRRAHRLRCPQQQEARGQEGVVEEGQYPLLQPRLEVDEHVAAADQVHAAERRVPGHVMSCEDAGVADRLDHPVAAVHLGEEPLQALRRDVLRDVRQVPSRPRLLQGTLGEVGAEDLEGRSRLQPARAFQEADDDRIDLLAGGAPGHPHPHGHAGRPVLQQPRQDLLAQHLVRARVAEEGGDRDEAVLIEGLHLVRVAFEVARVAPPASRRGRAPCAARSAGRWWAACTS